ncbi:DUF2989 domain-containing protein [Vibrio aestuarianus]|uniref:DUF2989 domain-containing protein n=1 Tax=Vibrio aestuarianus TaxID=28171 RepID=A0AAX3U503_9VIBR|nr:MULTISPECIES: DUF2989 domain-containing protein [Vibrio]KOE82824.1 hypothetical protein ACS86_08340 [Vibrio alginolyticus]MDE1219772.1 DUF2989 domain-containing protein [Vibrio aestuarianus]MDE1237704.1 DUF2989 domain-containing protein [Vibrio aestuarianus]MDE1250068.1 DUF2989 domain-containing protein [Vibrio aestuarianus]MDE1252601.1 DUF2989 domain-containing protein [Vibrio aestuarianus]
MNRIKITLILCFPLLASGCFENNKNTEKLCADNPNLRCEQLNMDDGQCRIPRTDLIWHRFEVLKNPTDKNKIEEYGLVKSYRKCLELASQIQAIDQTKLKQRRFEALVNSGNDLDRIVKELKQSRSAQSLYFLWSQIGDKQAQRQFLQLEGKPELENAEMQYALATFYTNRDREKSIALLTHSLELSKGKPVNIEIIKSLASTNQILKHKEKAYIWAMVGKAFNVPVASEAELELLYGFTQEKFDRLDLIADQITEAIENGQFKASLMPSNLSEL